MRGSVLAIVLGLWVSAAAQDAPAPRKGPPNIVLFHVDDLGWRDVGMNGSRFYATPRLDAFAKEGLRLTDAYANAPNCAPSRACLMSGQYSPRHGVYTVGSSKRGKPHLRKLVPTENRTDLDHGVVTIAERLQAAGYVTAHVGKWHLGKDPRKHGFDVNVAGNTTGTPRGGYFPPYMNPQLADGPEGEYLTDRLTEEAAAFIAKNAKRPFFLHLAHYAVHTPIQAKEDKTAKYRAKEKDGGQKNARYAAMIESMDESLGRVLDALDEHGLARHTIVWFFADNGGHGGVTSNAPLRGAKGMLYEGGIRVPMAVRWPGRIEAGRVDGTPVIGTDLYPTFLSLAGVAPPKDQPLDGVDLLPFLTGARDLRERALFWHFPAYLQAGRWFGRPFRTTPAAAMRLGPWKLIEFFEDGRLELYDLATDRGERKDVSAAHAERVQAMHARMVAWRKSIGAPVPTRKNPGYRGGD